MDHLMVPYIVQWGSDSGCSANLEKIRFTQGRSADNRALQSCPFLDHDLLGVLT